MRKLDTLFVMHIIKLWHLLKTFLLQLVTDFIWLLDLWSDFVYGFLFLYTILFFITVSTVFYTQQTLRFSFRVNFQVLLTLTINLPNRCFLEGIFSLPLKAYICSCKLGRLHLNCSLMCSDYSLRRSQVYVSSGQLGQPNYNFIYHTASFKEFH